MSRPRSKFPVWWSIWQQVPGREQEVITEVYARDPEDSIVWHRLMSGRIGKTKYGYKKIKDAGK